MLSVNLSMRFIGPAVLALGIVFWFIVYYYSNPMRILELWDSGAKVGPVFVCVGACQLQTELVFVGWFLAMILMLVGTIISIESLFPREATPK